MEPYREQSIEAMAVETANSLKEFVQKRVDERVATAKKEILKTPRAISESVLYWRLIACGAVVALGVAGAALASAIHEHECNVRIEREKTERVRLENLKKEHEEARAKWEHMSCIKEVGVPYIVHDEDHK